MPTTTDDAEQQVENFLKSSGLCILIMGPKGGVGKTFIAQAVLAWLAARGIKPTVIEFDENARLQLMYGSERCHFFKVHKASIGEIERKPALLYQIYDQALQIARRSRTPVLFDFGANAFSPFCDYIHQQKGRGFFGKGENSVVLGVTTGNKDALRDVQVGFGYANQVFPAAKRAVVVNDADRNTRIDSDSDAMGILSKKCGCPAFYLPDVNAPEALSYALDKSLPLEILAIKEVSFWTKMGMLDEAAIRTSVRIEDFLLEAAAVFEEVIAGNVSSSNAGQ